MLVVSEPLSNVTLGSDSVTVTDYPDPIVSRVFKIMAWEHPWIKVGRSMEELYRNLRYGDIKQIGRSVVHRFKKATGHYDYK